MPTSLLPFDAPKAVIASPVVYTSGYACQQVINRYLKSYEVDQGVLLTQMIRQTDRSLVELRKRRKFTAERVEAEHQALVATMKSLPNRIFIHAHLDRHRVTRAILAVSQVAYLMQRRDRALQIQGLDIIQERHHYQMSMFAPRVHLVPHALARFMERGREPPEVLISQFGHITSISRFLESEIGPGQPIAFALPQGLLHGRTGCGTGESPFGFSIQTHSDLLTPPLRVLKPSGRGKANRDIDFITFYDTAMLSPALRQLRKLLLDVQTRCLDAAHKQFAHDFFVRRSRSGDLAILDAGRSILREALASPVWQAYRQHREDQESQRALAEIPTEPAQMANPFQPAQGEAG